MTKRSGVCAFVIAAALLAAACSSGEVRGDGPALTTPDRASTSTSTTTPVVTSSTPACPRRLRSSVDNPGVTGLDHTLVPITAASVRVCRYAAPNAPNANALVRFGVVTAPAAVRKLEAATNALHLIPNAERIPCPMNPAGVGWWIIFAGSGTPVVLGVSASDCGFVTNGVVSAAPSTSWLAALGQVARIR